MPLCLGGDVGDEAHGNGNGAMPNSMSAADLNAKRLGRPLSRKLIVVGDGATGKTSILNVYVNGSFPQVYEPTIFENYVKDVVIDGTAVDLSLWDTAGQEDFERLRALSYADTHVIMLCFSVDQPTSLENVETKWIDEIVELCTGVKLCLVALKCDLREDPNVVEKLARYDQKPVDYETGLGVARRIRASRYLECSAKHDRGVREAFEEAARVAISARRKGETRGSGRANDGGSSHRGLGCVLS